MATSETTNLQLVKYGAGTDNFVRTDYNGNLDKIDTFAGNTNEAITNINSNLAKKLNNNVIQNISDNGTSYTFDAPRQGNNRYCSFIIYGKSGAGDNNAFLYIGFVDTSSRGNVVELYSVKAHTTTFSGSYNEATQKLTITTTGTIYGGMNLIWRGN